MLLAPSYSWIDHSNRVIVSMMLGRDEKRGFMRMNIESEVSVSRPGSSQMYSGKSVDLSASGVRFITQMAVTVGETLAVQLNAGTPVTPPLAVTISVVRVIEHGDGRYDVAGLTRSA